MTSSLSRRKILTRAAVSSIAGVLGAALPRIATAQAKAPRLARTLRIVIPANAGGGWDQTGRALGAALTAIGAADGIAYENVGGKGGTIGLAKYAKDYSNDTASLFIGGMVMVGAVALQKPAVNLRNIRPLARLTSDYLVVAVAAASPIQNIRDLAKALRADLRTTPIAGGSAGGVDHIYAGILARASGADPGSLMYKPFASGPEVVHAVLSGSAAAGVSGYSEFSEALAAGKLRAIGVSAKTSVFGLPAFREQGLDAAMANWRGVFTGQGVSTARTAEMLAAVELATNHPTWQHTLKVNRWEPSWLTGQDLTDFIAMDLITMQVMEYLLKLKA